MVEGTHMESAEYDPLFLENLRQMQKLVEEALKKMDEGMRRYEELRQNSFLPANFHEGVEERIADNNVELECFAQPEGQSHRFINIADSTGIVATDSESNKYEENKTDLETMRGDLLQTASRAEKQSAESDAKDQADSDNVSMADHSSEFVNDDDLVGGVVCASEIDRFDAAKVHIEEVDSSSFTRNYDMDINSDDILFNYPVAKLSASDSTLNVLSNRDVDLVGENCIYEHSLEMNSLFLSTDQQGVSKMGATNCHIYNIIMFDPGGTFFFENFVTIGKPCCYHFHIVNLAKMPTTCLLKCLNITLEHMSWELHGLTSNLTYDSGGVSNILFLHRISAKPFVKTYIYFDMIPTRMTTCYCWPYDEKGDILSWHEDSTTSLFYHSQFHTVKHIAKCVCITQEYIFGDEQSDMRTTTVTFGDCLIKIIASMEGLNYVSISMVEVLVYPIHMWGSQVLFCLIDIDVIEPTVAFQSQIRKLAARVKSNNNLSAFKYKGSNNMGLKASLWNDGIGCTCYKNSVPLRTVFIKKDKFHMEVQVLIKFIFYPFDPGGYTYHEYTNKLPNNLATNLVTVGIIGRCGLIAFSLLDDIVLINSHGYVLGLSIHYSITNFGRADFIFSIVSALNTFAVMAYHLDLGNDVVIKGYSLRVVVANMYGVSEKGIVVVEFVSYPFDPGGSMKYPTWNLVAVQNLFNSNLEDKVVLEGKVLIRKREIL